MKNTFALALMVCFSLVVFGQEQPSTNYDVEIWNAEIFNKSGYDFIEIDVYNNGAAYSNMDIQVMYDDIYLANSRNENASLEALSKQTLHKFELPIEIPSNHKGKKIKVEIIISNRDHEYKEKMKVAINK